MSRRATGHTAADTVCVFFDRCAPATTALPGQHGQTYPVCEAHAAIAEIIATRAADQAAGFTPSVAAAAPRRRGGPRTSRRAKHRRCGVCGDRYATTERDVGVCERCASEVAV